MFGLAEPILTLLQLSPALRELALPFLTLMGATLVLEALIQAISAVLRAHGHTRAPMVVAIAQNVLNVVGNCILLFGLFGAPKMGVLGVALSTVFSRVVACMVMWLLLQKMVHLKVQAADFFGISLERLRRILHIGVPTAAEQISWFLAFMTVTAFTARMGDQALATQTADQAEIARLQSEADAAVTSINDAIANIGSIDPDPNFPPPAPPVEPTP